MTTSDYWAGRLLAITSSSRPRAEVRAELAAAIEMLWEMARIDVQIDRASMHDDTDVTP